jgi:hypothetical protein
MMNPEEAIMSSDLKNLIAPTAGASWENIVRNAYDSATEGEVITSLLPKENLEQVIKLGFELSMRKALGAETLYRDILKANPRVQIYRPMLGLGLKSFAGMTEDQLQEMKNKLLLGELKPDVSGLGAPAKLKNTGRFAE